LTGQSPQRAVAPTEEEEEFLVEQVHGCKKKKSSKYRETPTTRVPRVINVEPLSAH